MLLIVLQYLEIFTILDTDVFSEVIHFLEKRNLNHCIVFDAFILDPVPDFY